MPHRRTLNQRHSKQAVGESRSQATELDESRPATSDPEWDKLSQREKFIRTAREVEADETGEALDEALRKIGKVRQR
jgi:hypothetical protein